MTRQNPVEVSSGNTPTANRSSDDSLLANSDVSPALRQQFEPSRVPTIQEILALPREQALQYIQRGAEWSLNGAVYQFNGGDTNSTAPFTNEQRNLSYQYLQNLAQSSGLSIPPHSPPAVNPSSDTTRSPVPGVTAPPLPTPSATTDQQLGQTFTLEQIVRASPEVALQMIQRGNSWTDGVRTATFNGGDPNSTAPLTVQQQLNSYRVIWEMATGQQIPENILAPRQETRRIAFTGAQISHYADHAGRQTASGETTQNGTITMRDPITGENRSYIRTAALQTHLWNWVMDQYGYEIGSSQEAALRDRGITVEMTVNGNRYDVAINDKGSLHNRYAVSSQYSPGGFTNFFNTQQPVRYLNDGTPVYQITDPGGNATARLIDIFDPSLVRGLTGSGELTGDIVLNLPRPVSLPRALPPAEQMAAIQQWGNSRLAVGTRQP